MFCCINQKRFFLNLDAWKFRSFVVHNKCTKRWIIQDYILFMKIFRYKNGKKKSGIYKPPEISLAQVPMYIIITNAYDIDTSYIWKRKWQHCVPRYHKSFGHLTLKNIVLESISSDLDATKNQQQLLYILYIRGCYMSVFVVLIVLCKICEIFNILSEHVSKV